METALTARRRALLVLAVEDRVEAQAAHVSLPHVRHAQVQNPHTRPARVLVFFFSSRRRHTRLLGDWSSDVCSSDLGYCSSRVVNRSTEDQGVTMRIPGSRGFGSTKPKACRTPTWPALITTSVDPNTTRTPTTRAARLRTRSAPPIGRPLLPSVRTVAAPRRRKNATARSTRPKTSSPMVTPGCEEG